MKWGCGCCRQLALARAACSWKTPKPKNFHARVVNQVAYEAGLGLLQARLAIVRAAYSRTTL